MEENTDPISSRDFPGHRPNSNTRHRWGRQEMDGRSLRSRQTQPRLTRRKLGEHLHCNGIICCQTRLITYTYARAQQYRVRPSNGSTTRLK